MADCCVTRGDGLLERLLAKKRAKIADSVIPESLRKGRILDIGCGRFPLFLVQTKFGEKYGLDKRVCSEKPVLDSNFLKIIEHDVEKEEKLPFADNYFDVVTMLAVFEHIEPIMLVQLLGEIHRVLKKQGVYILTTPASWTHRLLQILAKLKFVSSIEIDEHKAAYDSELISRYLRAASFNPEKISSGHFELYMNLWILAEK